MEPQTTDLPANQARQQARNQAALALLQQWQNDTSGYEEDSAEAIDRALSRTEADPLLTPV